MTETRPIWRDPEAFLRAERPDAPVLCLSPRVLQASYRRFHAGFPGLVTYAVKANPAPIVLDNLAAAGLAAFDVASPEEMAAVRDICPGEIAAGVAGGVTSWSVDCPVELEKLARAVAPGAEIAVRFRLAVIGAAYDFGSKFGADPEEAAALLAQVAARGFRPSLTFHPGTQCTAPEAWGAYVRAAAEIAGRAGVRLHRLNVGGGFPAERGRGEGQSLDAIFAAIGHAAQEAFAGSPPPLVAEPGRAMVADAMVLVTRIQAIRARGDVFLNDGIYGGLAECGVLGTVRGLRAISPEGHLRRGTPRPRVVFGPTCDSLDRLAEPVPLPDDAEVGDYLIFPGMGAYSLATVTRFNGYGAISVTTVHNTAPDAG